MAGAAGYVLKQIRSNDLVDAVRRVGAGQNLLDPAVTARVSSDSRGPDEDETIARLSPQEHDVLALLSEGLTNRQIAARMHLAEKTIKNYVTSVLSKMGMGGAPRQRCTPPATCTTGSTARPAGWPQPPPACRGSGTVTASVDLPERGGHRQSSKHWRAPVLVLLHAAEHVVEEPHRRDDVWSSEHHALGGARHAMSDLVAIKSAVGENSPVGVLVVGTTSESLFGPRCWFRPIGRWRDSAPGGPVVGGPSPLATGAAEADG